MNSTIFPILRRAKSEPKLVVKFFDENRGEVIQSPTKSIDSWSSIGVRSTWRSCFDTDAWGPYSPKLVKRKII